MVTQSKGWAVATLAAAFVAGGLVAWGLALRFGHGPGAWDDGRGMGRLFGPRGAIHSYLKHELSLTPAQEDSVRAIFERHRAEMEALWRSLRPRFDSLRATVDSEISAQLTPAQRARFDALRRQMDNRLRRGAPPPPPAQ